MFRILALIAYTLSMTAAGLASPEPTHLWSRYHGDTSTDRLVDVTVDSGDNIVIVGSVQGTVDFGGGGMNSSGQYDIAIAGYDRFGVHRWSVLHGGAANDIPYAVATGPEDQSYVVGTFTTAISFGGAGLLDPGITGIFVVRLDANGSVEWSRGFGDTGADAALDVAVDQQGNIWVTGYFSGTVDFGGGPLTSDGSTDLFLLELDPTGAHLFSQRFGSTASDQAWSVVTDANNDVYMTGLHAGTVDFGGGPLVSAGLQNAFLVKFDPNGTHLWSQTLGGTSGSQGVHLAMDSAGNLLMTGNFQGTADFGGDPLVSAGGRDILLARFAPDGTHLRSRNFGGTGNDYGRKVAAGPRERVFLTGSFEKTLNFGGEDLIAPGSSDDAFLAKFDGDGSHLWSQDYGLGSIDVGRALALDSFGDFYMGGSFSGSIDLGAGPQSTAGGDDIFLAKFTEPIEPMIQGISDIGNDQGRTVKVRFTRSGHDHRDSSDPVIRYDVYRRNDLLAEKSGWTFVGSTPAHVESGYGLDVETLADSTIAQGMFQSAFYVRAATATPAVFFDSPPDSGYSLDNLSPGVPGGFKHDAGLLAWKASRDSDLDLYVVYGAAADDFAMAIPVGSTRSLELETPEPGYDHYFLTARDKAGNESDPASLAVERVEGIPPRMLSVDNHPNPFNPSTKIRYEIPRGGPVSLVIFDARGRRVTTLLERTDHSPGRHEVVWDGTDAGGAPTRSGVYFARITNQHQTLTTKMLLVK